MKAYERQILAQIKYTQSIKYEQRVDKTIMKTQFLGEQTQKLKNTTDKYNIPIKGISPFISQPVEDKNALVNKILEKEKKMKDLMFKRAMNKSPFQQEKFREVQERAKGLIDPEVAQIIHGGANKSMSINSSKHSLLNSYKKVANRHEHNHKNDPHWKRSYNHRFDNKAIENRQKLRMDRAA